MERSGTLAEPSDNSTTPYIKKRPTLLGQPLFYRVSRVYFPALGTAYVNLNIGFLSAPGPLNTAL